MVIQRAENVHIHFFRKNKNGTVEFAVMRAAFRCSGSHQWAMHQPLFLGSHAAEWGKDVVAGLWELNERLLRGNLEHAV